MVVNEALALLRKHCDSRANEGDILLFGPNCGVSSALPQKYGLDNLDLCIYNISKDLDNSGCRLFGEARCGGGYIDLLLSGNGLASVAEVFRREHPDTGNVSDSFEVGCNAGYIHAAFLHTANTAAGGFLIPCGFWAKRALWFCMMADSPKQRSLALEAAYKALDEHRRFDSLFAETAAVIAAAVYEWV